MVAGFQQWSETIGETEQSWTKDGLGGSREKQEQKSVWSLIVFT